MQLLKDRYDESVGQKNALMEESQMLQVGRVISSSPRPSRLFVGLFAKKVVTRHRVFIGARSTTEPCT